MSEGILTALSVISTLCAIVFGYVACPHGMGGRNDALAAGRSL